MATTSTLYGSTTASTERFSAEAAGWDSNPFVHQATDAAYKALTKTIPALKEGNHKFDVLEIGCGTGVLSLQIAQHVHTVVAVDAAQGMIDVLKTKLQKPDAPSNVIPVCVLLEDPEDPSLPSSHNIKGSDTKDTPRMKFDLILSHLVLHHIAAIPPVLTTMLGCLKPGTGQIALTDFEDFGPEAKKFHPRSKLSRVEHHGIKRDWMEKVLKEVGFVDVDVSVGWRIDKMVERYEGEFEDAPNGAQGEGLGEVMEFPFLICRGRRP